MDIAPNAHNLQKRVDYALANLKQNAPDISARMSWHWTTIAMSNRMHRAAGLCKYWRKQDHIRLQFSESTFQSLPEMDKTDTVIHELAHAICFRLSLDKGHGYHFKRICKLMGGSGERLLKVEAGQVKRNLVKRWVLTRKSNPSKLAIRTRKDAEDYKYVYGDAVLLGVIQVDQNTKRLRWLSALTPEVRTVNPLEGKYEMMA
jgi:hypothetical protein